METEIWKGIFFSFFPLFNVLSVGLMFVIFLSGTSRVECRGGAE